MTATLQKVDPFGLSYTKFILEGMEAEWVFPKGAAPPKVLLFAKINDVLVNNPKANDTLISFAVLNTGIPALTISYHYRLKECFPGALDNFKLGYEWLLKNGYAAEDIILACDSPGGCLTISLLSFLFENQEPMPFGGIRLYPEESPRPLSYDYHGFRFMEMNYLRNSIQQPY